MTIARFASVALSLAALVLAVGCSSPSKSDVAAAEEYVLVTLKRGPRVAEKSDAERQEIQAGHMANIRRLADEHKLVVAGPYGKENHDPTSRGIFIFDVDSIAEAKTLTDTDPAVVAGVLAMETETLATASDLRGAVARDSARDAQLKAQGRELPMNERIRAYVLVRADDGARAAKVIAAAIPAKAVLIDGRVNVTKGFWVIDAPDCSTVREWLGTSLDALGPCTIDEWWSTTTLVPDASPTA
ncbi:MAG: hypothetical protein JNM94_09930 [Phycisphaerae bacterium]|nr:hypothetical protein [Phycisphaerae bacterium]